MEVWVLGCGPSLAEVQIPQDVFTIGTNNSYKHQWSPIWAGTDLRALRRDYNDIEDNQRPLLYLSAIDPARVGVKPRQGRPLVYIPHGERVTLRKAGVFAYWAALRLFGATQVHLIGFDMEANATHFDSDALTNQTYISQRYQLVKLQKEYGVPSWIWIDNKFYPIADLPTTGYELGGLTYTGQENDVTQGFPMPQDYWKHLRPEWYEARRKFVEAQKRGNNA